MMLEAKIFFDDRGNGDLIDGLSKKIIEAGIQGRSVDTGQLHGRNRNRGSRQAAIAKVMDHHKAIELGNADIDEDEIILVGTGHGQAGLAVESAIAATALPLDHDLQKPLVTRIILDNQHLRPN